MGFNSWFKGLKWILGK